MPGRMGASLDVPELIDIVLENFRINPSTTPRFSKDDLISDRQKLGTLFSAALASKRMYQSALPILWSTLDGISPLLKLIPPLKFNSHAMAYVLNRPLSEGDFNRVRLFAAMVKHITVSRKYNDTSIHPSAMFHICIYRGNQPLIPSLQTLQVRSDCDYAEIMLTNTLKSVKIIAHSNPLADPVYEEHPSAWNLLLLLPTRTPFLEHLEIGVTPLHSNRLDILKLKHLRSLIFNDMYNPTAPPQFIRQLETLPNLRVLDISRLSVEMARVRQTAGSGASDSPEPCFRFPELESLAFTSQSKLAADVLGTIQPNTLKTLVINNKKIKVDHDSYYHENEDQEPEEMYWDVDEWYSEDHGDAELRAWKEDAQSYQKILSDVAESQFLSLTKLHITNWNILDSAWLKPLESIPGMQEFDLQYARCSNLTDNAIEELVSAWPQLEIFRLFSSPDTLSTTLASVQSFARYCPNLKSLSLDLKFQVAPGSGSSSSPTASYRQLKRLAVFSVSCQADVQEKDRPALVQRLQSLFPSLVYAFVERRGDYAYTRRDGHRQWGEVFDIMMRGLGRNERLALKDMFHPEGRR